MKKFKVKTFRKGGWIKSRDEEFTVYAEKYYIKDNTVTFLSSNQAYFDRNRNLLFHKYELNEDRYGQYTPTLDNIEPEHCVASFCASEYTVILTDQFSIEELYKEYMDKKTPK